MTDFFRCPSRYVFIARDLGPISVKSFGRMTQYDLVRVGTCFRVPCSASISQLALAAEHDRAVASLDHLRGGCVRPVFWE